MGMGWAGMQSRELTAPVAKLPPGPGWGWVSQPAALAVGLFAAAGSPGPVAVAGPAALYGAGEGGLGFVGKSTPVIWLRLLRITNKLSLMRLNSVFTSTKRVSAVFSA